MKYPIEIPSLSATLLGGDYSGFEEDCIRIRGPATVASCTITDTLPTDKAHRDAIQLIPPSDAGLYNQQYALGILSDVLIASNSIVSTGALQGIFCSDGLCEHLDIVDNVIDTQSYHKVTLNGLLSGTIDGNVDATGAPAQIILNPARIGGGISSQNVWISSFKDKDYTLVECENLTDNRHKQKDKNGLYLEDFDLALFREQAMLLEHKSTAQYCTDLQALAKELGC